MIRVQNIYHMLAYAFSVLTERGYRDVATEDFDNVGELCAAILERGIASQVKRGLGREYVGRTEVLSSLRGKVEVTESVKSQALLRRQMVCSYDEFSVDSKMNRAIKATVAALVRSDISKARKKSLKKLMVYFADVAHKEAELAATGASHEVSGMLLYAKTDEEIQPDGIYQMSGNQISVKTLDLNQPFEAIRAQLDAITEEHLAKEAIVI